MNHFGSALLLGVVLLVAPGCHRYQRGTYLGYQDAVVSSRNDERASSLYEAEVRQNGTRLELDLRQRCQVIEVQQVERTHRHERVSTSGSRAWIVPLVGGLLLGTGIYFLATVDDRPIETDPRSTETTLTRGGAYAVGGGGVALGVGGLAWGLGHAIEVSRDDRTTERLGMDGEVVETDRACAQPRPAAGVAVSVSTSTGSVALGETDAAGALKLDLARWIPRASVVGAEAPGRASVLAGGSLVGAIDLSPVGELLDAEAWARAEPLRCASPRRADDCRALTTYAADFPWGAHGEEALRTLRSARETLATIAAREEAERLAEAERQRALEEERSAEAERARVELERQRHEEAERMRREYERQEREYEAMLAAERREQQEGERQERERRECRGTCRTSCGGLDACVAACVREHCD